MKTNHTAKAVFRIEKLKNLGQIKNRIAHSERTNPPANADEAGLVIDLMPRTGGAYEATKARLEGVPRRKNSVLCLESVFSASPDWFNAPDGSRDPDKINAWADATLAFLFDTFGEDNLAGVQLHLDEQTPHIHAFAVPREDTAKGSKLNASKWTGGKERLSALQTAYGEAVEGLGIQRGTKGSRAKHKALTEFYSDMPAQVAFQRGVEAFADGLITADEQTQRVAFRKDLPEPQKVELREAIAPARDRLIAWMIEQQRKMAARFRARVGALLDKAEALRGRLNSREAIEVASIAQTAKNAERLFNRPDDRGEGRTL